MEVNYNNTKNKTYEIFINDISQTSRIDKLEKKSLLVTTIQYKVNSDYLYNKGGLDLTYTGFLSFAPGLIYNEQKYFVTLKVEFPNITIDLIKKMVYSLNINSIRPLYLIAKGESSILQVRIGGGYNLLLGYYFEYDYDKIYTIINDTRLQSMITHYNTETSRTESVEFKFPYTFQINNVV